LERRTKAVFKMVIIYRLAEVAMDAIFERSLTDDLIRVCGNEDGWDGVPRVDEVPIELESSHSGHLYVAHQACG